MEAYGEVLRKAVRERRRTARRKHIKRETGTDNYMKIG
jgi:hypothetical protein